MLMLLCSVRVNVHTIVIVPLFWPCKEAPVAAQRPAVH